MKKIAYSLLIVALLLCPPPVGSAGHQHNTGALLSV